MSMKTVKVFDSINDMRFGQGASIENVMDDNRRTDGSWSLTVGDTDGNLAYTLHLPAGKIVKIIYPKPTLEI